MGKRFTDTINIGAVKEAKAFKERVEQYTNDPRYAYVKQFNGMTTDEYMELINKRGYKTLLNEKDFHAVQETTFFHNLAIYLEELNKESNIELSIMLELLKIEKPDKYNELIKDIEEVTENEKEHYKPKEEEKVEETKMNHVKPINPREKTELMATITAGLDAIFKNMRTANEVRFALYSEAIESQVEKSRLAVREEKPKTNKKSETK